MDKGEFIKGGYMVRPGDGGSWIVYSEAEFGQDGARRYVTPTRGFTDYQDLMKWLESEHEALAFPLVTSDPTAKPTIPDYIRDNLPEDLRNSLSTTEAPK
jgi:hypothetical protein